MKMRVLPESFLRCMTPQARRKVGQMTAAEATAKGEAQSEKALQRDIVNLLRLRGIEVIFSRMDKRTHNNLGTPDLLFSVIGGAGGPPRVYACAWECKLPGRHMDSTQIQMRKRMVSHPNHWSHRVIHSVDEAIQQLDAMGIV